MYRDVRGKRDTGFSILRELREEADPQMGSFKKDKGAISRQTCKWKREQTKIVGGKKKRK